MALAHEGPVIGHVDRSGISKMAQCIDGVRPWFVSGVQAGAQPLEEHHLSFDGLVSFGG